MYCLVVTYDYSRFTWVFFLASEDETGAILKTFITRIENIVDHKVKVIRYDNGIEFKNREMNQFCEIKGKFDGKANTNNELPFNLEMLALEDISTFNFLSNHEDNDEANINNMDTTIQVSSTPTTRIHKDHPLDQVIGDLHSTTQTRHMSKNLEEHGKVRIFKSWRLANIYLFFDLFIEKSTLNIHLKSRMQAPQWKLKRFCPRMKMVKKVDVHMYRSMIGSLTYLTSSRPDIMFAVCAYARYQYKKQTMVANSITKAEYMAASSCRGQIDNEREMCKNRQSDLVRKRIEKIGQLQALVDGKKILITESTIRKDLQLEDDEGVDCLPNAVIFEQLILISTMVSAIICLATNQKFNFSKYIFESMVKNLDNVNKFFMYPRNMKRVGKGFSKRDTPLFPTMMVQDQEDMGEDRMEDFDTLEFSAVKNSSYKGLNSKSNSYSDRESVSAEGETFRTTFELEGSLLWS
nr:putative ribonuclease H-like domain-containing protein [Tanacetum cinerariifolium]